MSPSLLQVCDATTECIGRFITPRPVCLHEFLEARKAAYFKPMPSPFAPICLSWSHLDIFIGKSHDRKFLYFYRSEGKLYLVIVNSFSEIADRIAEF